MTSCKKVFILGLNGFPSGGSARIEKLKLIGKALVYKSVNVTFVNNSWGFSKKGEIPASGSFEEIDYIYTSGITYRPNTFLLRRWVEFKGKINEIIFLVKNKPDVAIVSVVSGMFFNLYFYWILSRLKGFKIYYPHHEEPEVTLDLNNLYNRINLYFFNKFAWKIIDGVFPISRYLENKIKQNNPRLPLLRIPAIADFDIFNEVRKSCDKKSEKYFMYCGSVTYYEIIEFLISAFENLPVSEFNLHLVFFGESDDEKKLKQRIEKSLKKNQIYVFGFLDYKTLVEKYINSSGLLIPLRDNLQDIARFPHKIGEYTASGNPLITNKIGDLNYYFEDRKDIIFAESYSEKYFSEAMNFVVNFPVESKRIGEAGYQIGSKFFNYKNYSLSLIEFMKIDK
jgi:glycosyltransferase involved in cell wall biosynthesis